MSDFRVKQSEVREIITTDFESLLPFIAVADSLVTSKVAGQGLSDAELKEITRWLAAHFVAVADPRAKSEKTDEAQATYFMGKEGTGLDATSYGQQVKILDTTGSLANSGKGAAKLEAIA